MGTKGIERWCDMAEAEAEALMGALPLSLREKLSGVSVTVSGRPSPEDIMEEGDEENLLGLFVGAALRDEGADAELSPEIRLFVENI
ncbi:MAG: hypothetical protein FWF84_06605, partial [Kiritimatiellaeota bacterium]|nr:hypothetical protein [Kiritimatiellota bacterium]